MENAFARLGELRAVEEGAPLVVLDRAEGLLRLVDRSLVDCPYIFTDEDGFVVLEWEHAWLTLFSDGSVRFLHESAGFERRVMDDDAILSHMKNLWSVSKGSGSSERRQ